MVLVFVLAALWAQYRGGGLFGPVFLALVGFSIASFVTFFFYSPRAAGTLWVLAVPSMHLVIIVALFGWVFYTGNSTPYGLIIWTFITYFSLLGLDHAAMYVWPQVAQARNWKPSAPFAEEEKVG